MIQEAIAKAVSGHDLSEPEMIGAMDQIMEGKATPAQIGALLIALRMKGESLEEISGGGAGDAGQGHAGGLWVRG